MSVRARGGTTLGEAGGSHDDAREVKRLPDHGPHQHDLLRERAEEGRRRGEKGRGAVGWTRERGGGQGRALLCVTRTFTKSTKEWERPQPYNSSVAANALSEQEQW